MEWTRGPFRISTEASLLDADLIHGFLTRCYWARGIPRAVVERSIRGSLCFGVYEWGRQVGFARAVTDRATYAHLADVFIVESHRGRGLSKWLIACIRAHPDLQGLRRWGLATRDAQGLYRQFGFRPLAKPERFMEIHDPHAYTQS